MTDKRFDLQEKYKQYLQKVGIDDEMKLPESQRRETRRTFMGACGLMLLLFRDDLPTLDPPEAYRMYDDMTDQVSNFFKTEIKNQST